MTTPKPARERAEEMAGEILSLLCGFSFGLDNPYAKEFAVRHDFVGPGEALSFMATHLAPLLEELDTLKFQVANWERKEITRASCCAAYEEEVMAGRIMEDARYEAMAAKINLDPLWFKGCDFLDAVAAFRKIRKRNEKDGL